jgi:RNA polymerase sigma-70 factor, ECF subfamily
VAVFRTRDGKRSDHPPVAAPGERADPLRDDARRAGGGDGAAFERLVRSTQADVWRLCSHLGSREAADDLAQETYLRAWRSLPSFRGDSSVRTWVLAIARRVAADHIRAAGRLRRLATLPPGDGVHPDGTGVVDVDLLLQGLDDDRRLAMYLTQVLGLSYAEAAAVCDCPIGTIRSRVARARQELVEGLRIADAQ